MTASTWPQGVFALQRWLRRWLARRAEPLPCVRQHDEEDCGAACVATICLAHGRSLPVTPS
ncbi:MAG: hypothetical protein FJ050_00230 [Cyanobacteria bacterium M_surface_7_m2_040]|nr:hypothetical protein [Cyanobacteria bacterium K_Offshore_0m_m2_072]MBM5826488.1 hypothetical protein [Cyanobacteria bacterium M_surface_7_m2_040]